MWKELLCRIAFVRTIIHQNQQFNTIYSANRKFRRKYEISGLTVIFEPQLQAFLYVILKEIARETTFVWNILSKSIILMRESQKTSLEGTFTPPGGCLQGLLTCFPTLRCNMESYEQLSSVSDQLLKIQGWGTILLRHDFSNVIDNRVNDNQMV